MLNRDFGYTLYVSWIYPQKMLSLFKETQQLQQLQQLQ